MAKQEDEDIKPSREELRAKFFSQDHIERKRISFTYFGVDLEWHQPTVQMVTEMQDQDSGRNFVIDLLMTFTYLPGTDEKFFEPGDYEKLVNQPINGDFRKVTDLIVKGIDLEVDTKVKN